MMQLLKKILNRLNGLHYTQEYLCLASPLITGRLYAYLVEKNRIIRNITDQHLFVGYCPLIFAFSQPALTGINNPASIDILFSPKLFNQNAIFLEKDATARLQLKKTGELTGEGPVFFYEGEKGKHCFVSGFRQSIISAQNRWFNKKQGNVFLDDNLYKQVQIAYALPRIISLITVEKDGLFNLFPTDLHGQIDPAHYIISLRHTGKACQQVLDAKKILITQIHRDAFKTAYGLGKNHMQPLKEKSSFPFSEKKSALLELPLAPSPLYYRELELKDSFRQGIHQLMLFRILQSEESGDRQLSLSHIHQAYATWLYNNDFPGNYLLR
jgi:hypothetical protein